MSVPSDADLKKEHHAYQKQFKLASIVKCPTREFVDSKGVGYTYGWLSPCKGMFFITHDSAYYLSGQVRLKGNGGGTYPDYFLDMIDGLFGPEPLTLEVCSRTVQVDTTRTAATVDLDPKFNPTYVTDGQILAGVPKRKFRRWRSDPPYNEKTAREMYGCDLPNFKRLLEAGAMACMEGALMFLLVGADDNYQHHPPGVVRVGQITCDITPNNEKRTLNIYQKYKHYDIDGESGSQMQL